MVSSRHSVTPTGGLPVVLSGIAILIAVAVLGWFTIQWPDKNSLDTSLPISSTTPSLSVESEKKPALSLNDDSLILQTTDNNTSLDQPEPPTLEWKSYTIRKGDTLGKIFNRFGIGIGLASEIVRDEQGKTLKRLLPDRDIDFAFNTENELVEIRYEVSRLDELVIEFTAGSFNISKQKAPVEIKEKVASQTIHSSLFVSGSAAGLSDRVIMDLVSVFGWDIDFALDIRRGDRFSVIYEELYRDEEFIGSGDIIAAIFVNNGATYEAIRHIDEHGKKEYFDANGANRRGTFLKTPMKISRITSGFSNSRFHPVLKKWRAHRGVDYGAPRGTPVLATADGRVHFVGRNGGYGKTIILRHGGEFSTLYAHLSGYAKDIKRGASVRQGEAIGYVGSTGLATGPHLHYEFRVNDVHRNPLTFETPRAKPIAQRYKNEFLAFAKKRIDQISSTVTQQVASSTP